MNILVSACLLGVCCRYDGTGKDIGLKDKYPNVTFVQVCPEVLGGLSIPRSSAEISQGRVVNIDGCDVTKEFAEGAQKALEIAFKNNCAAALLKARSPSCGSSVAYDGSFKGKLVRGDGVLAALLKENGIKVFSEENLGDFDEYLQAES